MMNSSKISQKDAITLCKEINRKYSASRIRFLKFGYWQCWGCQRFGNKDGSYSNICALNGEDNRGCRMVNSLYERNIVKNDVKTES
jgi:hypothetical protein